MAVLFVGPIMEIFDSEKNIHPFFEKRNKTYDDQPGAAPISFNTKTASKNSAAGLSGIDEEVKHKELAARNPSPLISIQSSNNQKVSGSKVFKEQSAELLDVDPNLSRRKRQKSVSPDVGKHGHQSLDSSTGNIHKLGDGDNWQSEAILSSGENGNDCGTSLTRTPRAIDLSASASTVLSSRSELLIQQDNVETPTESLERFQISQQPLLTDVILSVNEERVTMDPTSFKPSEPISAKPKKQLRLNPKTGTIGSPPANKLSKISNIVVTKKSEKGLPKSKCSLVIIKYGHDTETRSNLGQKINKILRDSEKLSLLKPLARSLSAIPLVQNPKSTHPFFIGKAAPIVPPPHDTPITPAVKSKSEVTKRPKSSMTLGEAKSHSPSRKNMQASSHSGFQHFGNKTKIFKFPGAVEACWPPRGMVHIKFPDEVDSSPKKPAQVSSVSALKKSKYTATETLAKENILNVVAAELDVKNAQQFLKMTNTEDFADPEKSLRLPVKHFENGYQLQRRIWREISVKISSTTTLGNISDSEDELHGDGTRQRPINPALLKIYKSLPYSLTAFDRSQYETQPWIHKYSPRAAAEVLQSGKEPLILKEWLQSLTVTAVDSALTDVAFSGAGSVASRKSGNVNSEKSGRKKRKSNNKLEGFVVSSDDEMNEMDEITDPEEHSENCQPGKRTVVRSSQFFSNGAKDSKKLKNAAVVSGPSGCGKTAMIYAVAKELGFEVFEINSSSRRSGKEILEKVGDMTRNHLVHLPDQPSSSDPQNEDSQRISDAFSADLKSGRQGTMNSFFKPKKSGTPALKAIGPKAVKKMVINDEALKPQKLPPKQQTQSLILLEEVDVLFEEDKQFWATIMGLISQSKRPIIMTCNDETLLPLQTLELHAIIRLSPPPPEIAIDYMLLVAAAEGHSIKRKAVEALYKSRHSDLRASMTELDYWCQLGIGDQKGGLDWYYPRWPPGCDVDESGHTIRVVSEGTYKSGMGWLGRDVIFEHPDDPSVREEILREAWDWWNIDIGDWHESFQITSSQQPVKESQTLTLSSYEAFAESMSIADICACGSFATGNQVALDADSIMLTEKAREDFTIGNELLHADITTSYDMLGKNIAIWMKCQAQGLSQPAVHLALDRLSESQVFSKIAETAWREEPLISRRDFSIAFDPIAESEKNTIHSSSSLEHSVFDRTTTTIALDVAPYVRSIVANDAKLQQERARLSNLLSEGGRKGKRLRTTRSALSALEGGSRKSTRPEKYFRAMLNPHLVNRTGLPSWQDAVSMETSETETRRTPPAVDFSESCSPEMTDSSG